jgi:RHS repeat-associated protein
LYQTKIRIAAETDANGNVVSRFIYVGRKNTPKFMIKSGQTYEIVADQVGSPRLVVNASDGTVAQQIDYDEFGRILFDSNPGFQPFGFAGGLYDTATGLVRFGARDYDPYVGRWLSKDPIGLSSSTNTYEYASNDPINFVDSSGHGDWPGTADNGVVHNNSGRDIIVIDDDNDTSQILPDGGSTSIDVDTDFIKDGDNYTKVGPNDVTVNKDGSVTQNDDWWPGHDTRKATEEEKKLIDNHLKTNPPPSGGGGGAGRNKMCPLP